MPISPPRPDEDLSALHRRLRKPLMAFFLRRVGEQSEAEDLTQEVFARLAANPDMALQCPEAYVFQMAANLLRDRGRREKARYAALGVVAGEEAGRNRPPDSERIVINRERLKEVTAALDELSQRTRAIFLLRRLEALRYEEIAAMFSISVSAVKKHVANAAAHLALRVGAE